MASKQVGLIGLAVMGENLALNLAEKGFQVVVFNRTTTKVDSFLAGPAKGTTIKGTYSLEQFVNTLERPRRIILMVKAGEPVDEFINLLLPFLRRGDIIIDGGNSYHVDTTRRCRALKEKEILYVGCGISGGEEGARHGPSIMPGGNNEAWPQIKEMLQAIAAKTSSGEPCCDWIGPEGAGHFVKMVHNGIEYGDMQLICESYALLKELLGMDADALQALFSRWNEGELKSYLIEITSQIFGKKDKDGTPLVDKILDVAGQKGTGKWTCIEALDLGIPLSLISEAVFARDLSTLKEERLAAAAKLEKKRRSTPHASPALLGAIEQALFASKIVSYAQGFMLLKKASEQYGWNLDFGHIALIWREGCIIRSQFLETIKEAFAKDPKLPSLLLAPYFAKVLKKAESSWRKAVAKAALAGIPVPCLSSAFNFYAGYRTARLPVNLLQAQRDFFGAHTYERTDMPRGQFFHTEWLQK